MTIRKILEASTANITPDTMQRIEDGALRVTTMSGPYGAFVYVLDDSELESQLISEPDLLLVLRHGRAKGCDWVYFDADADLIEGLEDFTNLW